MRFPPQTSPPVRTGAALLLVLLIGILDYATGLELAFSIFYLLPVYLITWHAGLRAGVLVSVFSTAVWLAGDLLGGHEYDNALIPAWNTLVRLGIFIITTYLLARLKTTEERRLVFERIFFHDILNLAGAIRGYAELLRNGIRSDQEKIFEILHYGAQRIIDEIEAQRTLAAAEHGDLAVHPTPLHSLSFLLAQADLYRNPEISRGRRLEIDPGAAEFRFESDPVLLGRVLGNMIKNALEATSPEGAVTIGCRRLDNEVEFWVHNPGHIPAADQPRIFRPAFSTRGAGRGLGTYGMQLLSRYLRGKVTFSSTPREGTVFRARYPLSWSVGDHSRGT